MYIHISPHLIAVASLLCCGALQGNMDWPTRYGQSIIIIISSSSSSSSSSGIASIIIICIDIYIYIYVYT